MTPILIEEYQDEMRDTVCGVCMYFTKDSQNPGRCIHETSGQCSLFAHLDGVVDAISGVDSNSIAPYMEALRREVCAKCDHQDPQGICDLRDSRAPVPTWCTLNSYFNLVVGAVEIVQSKHAIGKP
jgi:hypothetical protein